jgi:hypothetical protein
MPSDAQQVVALGAALVPSAAVSAVRGHPSTPIQDPAHPPALLLTARGRVERSGGRLGWPARWRRRSSAALIATAVCDALCGSTPIITTAMTGISFRYPGVKTVTGTPNSRDNTGARAPLLSHATARPRHAGTSFESQAQQRAGSGYESQAYQDLSTLRARLTAIPARPATPANNWADIARGASAELSPSVAKQQHPRQAVLVTRAVLGYGL